MLNIAWLNTSALFLHVLAAIGLIAGGVVQVLAGTRLRRAVTTGAIESWATFARSAGPLIIVSAILSLFTGGHLAGAVYGGGDGNAFVDHPFITLGTVGLLLLAPVGPMVGGARLRRLAAAARDHGEAAAPAELRAGATDPALWGPVHSLVGVGVGFVWLMITKPDWITGIAGLIVTFALGWGAGVVAARAGA